MAKVFGVIVVVAVTVLYIVAVNGLSSKCKADEVLAKTVFGLACVKGHTP